MSERTPVTATLNGSGKPRLMICGDILYRSDVPCTYSQSVVEMAGSPILSPPLEPGQRLVAFVEAGAAPPKETYSRILAVDEMNGRIQIDGWSSGVPACIPAAPAAAVGGSGGVDPGFHRYAITFVVDGHETPLGQPSGPVMVPGETHEIILTNVPCRDEGANGVCTARNIYRTASGCQEFLYAGSIPDNTTGVYTDTIADDALGGLPEESVVPGFVIDGWIADLPRCQQMTETFEPYTIIHNLYRGARRAKFFGWHYHITLDYGKYLSADALRELRRQLAAAPMGRMVLIPRRDAPQFQYTVHIEDSLSIARYGKSPGYRNAVLRFAGTDLVSALPMTGGYGTGYATLYGSKL